MKKELFKKAINSNSLKERANSNNLYAKVDFNEWTQELLEEKDFSSVLDICCGTGNQLCLYAILDKVKEIYGVDISSDSIKTSKIRLDKLNSNKIISLNNLSLETMFLSDNVNRKFDLISCFYGLYYSKDVNKTLSEIMAHLNASGKVLIVGPYGENNKSLFDLLQKYFKLPEIVTRSSCTFMEEEVEPFFQNNGFKINKRVLKNLIKYPDVASVMNYWKASTFYNKIYEKNIENDLINHFETNNEFVIEKHIMAIWGKYVK